LINNYIYIIAFLDYSNRVKIMVNRNNKKDLVRFFLVTGGIIFGIIALIAYGFAVMDEKYLKMFDAKLDSYIRQQWNLGR